MKKLALLLYAAFSICSVVYCQPRIINRGVVINSPTTQASSLIFSNVTDQTVDITLTRGNGRGVIVLAHQAAAVDAVPANNTAYTADDDFGSGTQIGTGNYVVYKGESATFTIRSLSSNTAYYFQAFEFNYLSAGTEAYFRNTATGNPANQTTLQNIVAPTTQATNVAWDGDRRIRWTSGNGLRRVVVMKSGGAVDANPANGTTYAASTTFGAGTQIGTGNYVVYDGTAAFFDIDPASLSFSTTYGVRVYEYNISVGSPLYYTATATGNPLSHVTIASQSWYSYKDTPFLTRRAPYNLSTASREFSQLYPVGDYIGSTYHHVWFVAEGDGDVQGGIDRSIRYKRAIADDPTVKANWVADSPPNSDGDTPSFIDRSTFNYTLWSSATTYSIGQQVKYVNGINEYVYQSLTNGNINQSPPTNADDWTDITPWDACQNWGPMSVVEFGGKQYGIFVANQFLSQKYGVGLLYSTDEFATWTKVSGNPIIASSSTQSNWYVHVHPTKVGSYWYAFIQNYYPADLVENHLFSIEIWRTTSDPSTSGWAGWTKLTGHTDQLSGRGWYGAVDISQSWEDSGTFYAYISVNDPGVNGGYNMRPEGQTQYLSFYPVANKILLISWTDWTTFKDTYVVERIIYQTQQQTETDTRTWCPKRTFGGNDFFVSMDFLWKGQTALNGTHQIEPMSDGKIISRNLNTTGAYQQGSEIYPSFVKFAKPHQSHVNDVLGSTPNPFNVTTNSAGTVVGSPRAARANSIQAVDNGFVTFPNADFTYDPNYLAVTVIVGRTSQTGQFGVCGMDTDVVGGQHGWHIEHSSAGAFSYDFFVYSSDNVHYKQYRVNYNGNQAGNDATQLLILGLKFVNGVLSVRVDYNLDCTVTKIHDDSFTTLNVSDEPLRLGAIYPTTNDEKWCKEVVGSFLMFSGSANVTDAHWLYNNLPGY